jgi:hypothetical protein
MPFVKRDSLLLHDQKVDFDTQEQKPDFPTRDAKLELHEHSPAAAPRKRITPTPKFYLTRSQPTQFWRLWKAFLLGRRSGQAG